MTVARWAAALAAETARRARPWLIAAGWAASLLLAAWSTAAPALEILARLS